ncbi:MAG: hypothetical protein GY835_15715 [bacterium]|nr:hypothetical protein [bacterium]
MISHLRKAAHLLVLWASLCAITSASATTLREVYEQSGPAGGYDRWLELETGVTYTGGLLIGRSLIPYLVDVFGGPCEDVRIVGNGAILDLEGSQLCISYCRNRLDISDCVVINGNIRFRGEAVYDYQPYGSVRNVTIFQPHDYGIRLQGTGDHVKLERNIIVDAIDTGWDFAFSNGMPNKLIPTGINFGLSVQTGTYGVPVVIDNWSWHSDPDINGDLLHHFTGL